MKRIVSLLFLCGFFVFGFSQVENYASWNHSGSFFIITTPDGASLPENTMVRDFPVLIRLNSDFFDFTSAGTRGEDIRFAGANGTPLAYQIEEWNPEKGVAVIWVRIPLIKGNEEQEVKIYWGKSKAESESRGEAVFNGSNGFLSVYHLNEPIRDVLGTTKCKDMGSLPEDGVTGPARGFAGGTFIHCGDNITAYPSGNEERTTSAWIKAGKAGWAVDWGTEARCSENSIKIDKPPVLKHEGYLCDASGKTRLSYDEWHYASITYKNGDLIVYVNGNEDGRSVREFITPDNAYMRIGKRHNSGDNPWESQWWDGAIDEVRISSVARPAEWIKLEYENQNKLQSLVGPIVKNGNYFTVSDREIFINEGEKIEVKGEAQGARKIYWVLKSMNTEKVVAVDRLSYLYEAGRTTGDRNESLIFRALYPEGIREIEIPLIVYETIPDPLFEINAPAEWNGRDSILISPDVVNMEKMADFGAANLDYKWEISNIAVIKEIRDDKLMLKRSQNSGLLMIRLWIDNGGLPVSKTIAIRVKEPENDPRVLRTPGVNEKPVDYQFYARDDDNFGTVFVNGRARQRADTVVLKIFAGDELYREYRQKSGRRNSYAFTARIEAGLVDYVFEIWAVKPKGEKMVYRARDIVCGDVYLINGQSNAEAYDYGNAVNPYSSKWVRSYGSSSPDPEKSSVDGWGRAVSFDRGTAMYQLGYWGIELGGNIVRKYEMPVCIINGAVGGSRIDQHQRNDDNPEDMNTIYGRLLRRVKAAGLTNGVRAMIWHQGENNQGAAGPDDGFDWQFYGDYFTELAGSWKEDFPNISNYYMFQIWPDACSMGSDGSGDRLREVQRTLPAMFSNLSIMSSLGIRPGGGCHFPPEGYREMAELMMPLIERDQYNISFNEPVSPPDLREAYFTSQRRDEIALEFDQPMDWNKMLTSEFYLDGESGWVVSGSLWGRKIVLKLKNRSDASTISYLDGKNWDPDNILYGRNGIAALTFYEVPLRRMNGWTVDEQSLLARSPAPQPYPYISKGEFSGNEVHESPDPLVAYRWPEPKAEDGLELFTISPKHIDTDTPASFDNLQSLKDDNPMVTVRGPGSIRIDFGREMPAWVEFDSPDYQGGVEMSISEYNQPGVNKTGVPVRYGNTYRLELNDELYDGVRFAWIHVGSHDKNWHISDVRAVNQAKPANYQGSFSCSDQMLTRIWYMSAYSVRASMCKDYLGAIIMERGDRMSWTGDAHPIQAASLVAFGNYDFVRKNIQNTADQNNGIRSYSLYWVLSLIDYYRYTGDRETLDKFINNAANKLDDAYIEFGTNPGLRFYGWDERLTAGFELWFMEAPEAQRAYKMLTIRTWIEFAEVMKEVGRMDLESKYSWWARRKMAELRTGPDWLREYGMHSSADALNTGLLNQREHDSIFINRMVNRSDRLSLSPFNQYFIIQALAEMGKYDDAISTIRDIWGGMIENGATTPYEVYRPSWNEIIGPNDPVPNSQSGIVSLCHPWGAGPVKWLNEEVLGIKPASPGFRSWEILPHPGKRLEWLKGSTPTPYGELSASIDLINSSINVSSPVGTRGRIGVPRLGRQITSITINGILAWDGEYHPVPGIGGTSSDEEFVYLEAVEPGEYDITYEFNGKTSFYVEPHYQFLASFKGIDSLTRGNWGGQYGKDGYLLFNYLGDSKDKMQLPQYVDSVTCFRAFPKTSDHKPDYTMWDDRTTDQRALAPSEDNAQVRVAAGITNTGQTMTFTVHMTRKKKFNIALYFLDWNDEELSQAVEMFDAQSLNLISPVKKVDDFAGGKYLIFSYDKAVKFRINQIRGSISTLSGIFFDPVK